MKIKEMHCIKEDDETELKNINYKGKFAKDIDIKTINDLNHKNCTKNSQIMLAYDIARLKMRISYCNTMKQQIDNYIEQLAKPIYALGDIFTKPQVKN